MTGLHARRAGFERCPDRRARGNGRAQSFALSITELPSDDDEVIEEQGARVFLETGASQLLDDKALDARVDADQIAFVVQGR